MTFGGFDRLNTVALHPSQILHRQGERLRDVYFPNGGVVSMASVLSDGSMVEAATVGDEGFVGIEASLSDDATSACEIIVQVPVPHDSAEMMIVEHFRCELATRPTRYTLSATVPPALASR